MSPMVGDEPTMDNRLVMLAAATPWSDHGRPAGYWGPHPDLAVTDVAPTPA